MKLLDKSLENVGVKITNKNPVYTISKEAG